MRNEFQPRHDMAPLKHVSAALVRDTYWKEGVWQLGWSYNLIWTPLPKRFWPAHIWKEWKDSDIWIQLPFDAVKVNPWGLPQHSPSRWRLRRNALLSAWSGCRPRHSEAGGGGAGVFGVTARIRKLRMLTPGWRQTRLLDRFVSYRLPVHSEPV